MEGAAINNVLILVNLIIAEDAGMQQHRTANRGVEPRHVEAWLRLAGTQEIPFAIHPGLHPGMVVVGMRPAGGIDLAGRDADGTQGSNAQHALLATTSRTRCHCCQRAGSAGIGGLIGSLLVTPMVDFQYGIIHAHALHTSAEGIRPKGAEIIEVLVIDTWREDEMAELLFGDVPVHLAAHFEGRFHLCYPIRERLHRHVGQGEVAVEELHVAAFIGGECRCLKRLPDILLKLG